MLLSKGSWGYWEPKNVIATSVLKRTRRSGPPNYHGSFVAVYGRQCKIGKIRGYLSPRYRVCTKAMFRSKGSYGYGEPKNVIAVSLQKAHSPLRASKLPGFVYRRIWSTMETWENCGLPISKVPRLHHSNVYMKRKLRVRGA